MWQTDLGLDSRSLPLLCKLGPGIITLWAFVSFLKNADNMSASLTRENEVKLHEAPNTVSGAILCFHSRRAYWWQSGDQKSGLLTGEVIVTTVHCLFLPGSRESGCWQVVTQSYFLCHKILLRTFFKNSKKLRISWKESGGVERCPGC